MRILTRKLNAACVRAAIIPWTFLSQQQLQPYKKDARFADETNHVDARRTVSFFFWIYV